MSLQQEYDHSGPGYYVYMGGTLVMVVGPTDEAPAIIQNCKASAKADNLDFFVLRKFNNVEPVKVLIGTIVQEIKRGIHFSFDWNDMRSLAVQVDSQ